ncbi:high mobility group box domain-containing protein [Rhodofomes roseus]|uniref:High mobility group box domain-containing protein n=1 Tax=Rhodofomes roseus TaxID=34475 RepID=A0ABQ8KXM9_9APHY|nr:high mobility group box domain-containing protein [Rhodofomes roseus]KAH9843788.1 high mobility group box domain-containing protein [Rhodofomes roseus]
MAAHPDAGQAAAQYEYMKMQFATSLGHVAQQLRDCAAYADQLSGSVSGVPYNPAAMPLMQFPVPPGGLAAVASPATGKRKTREVEGKKTRKKKDPLAPKRPPSSYLLFQNEVRSELKKTHPGMPNNELLGMIAKQWSEMSQEDKEKYETLQKAAKDRYLDEKSAYQAGGSPATVVAPVAPPVVVAAPIAVKAVAPTPVVATTSDDDTSEDEEEGSSSDDTSDGSSSPPPKKQKGEQISKEKKKKKPSKA